MDLNNFQENLIKALSNDNQKRQQAETNLFHIKENDYESFLNLEFNSILSPINNRVPPICITRIYGEVLSGQLFVNKECAINFTTNFSLNLNSLLLDADLPEQFKMILTSILAILHVYMYQNLNDESISTYILTFSEKIPQLKKYLINSLYEITLIDPDLNGFSFDDILKLLVEDLLNQDLFIPRMHLYFAIACKNPDLQILQSIFESIIITPMHTPKFSLVVLESIATFADINSKFFTANAPLLFEKLIFLSSSEKISNEIRNLAIFCIALIVSNAPEIHKKIQNFYKSIITELVFIVSEITDDDPWEYDTNGGPCHQALYALKEISNSLKNQDGFKLIYQDFQSLLDPTNTEEIDGFLYGSKSWQAKFAFISSLTAAINQYCQIQSISPLFKSLIPLLDLKMHPCVRVATYRFIKKVCKRANDITIIMEIMDAVFQSSFNENLFITKQNAFKTIISFLNIQIAQINKDVIYKKLFTPYFKRLIDQLQTDPIKIRKYVAQCIGYIARICIKYLLLEQKVANNLYESFVIPISEAFYELLQESDQYPRNDIVIFIYSYAISLEDIIIPPNQRIIRAICNNFLHRAKKLSKKDFYKSDQLDKAIKIFSDKIGAEESKRSMNVIKIWLEDQVIPLLIDLCDENIFWVKKEITNSLYFRLLIKSDDKVKAEFSKILERILLIRPLKWQILSCFYDDISNLLHLDLSDLILQIFAFAEDEAYQAILTDDLNYFTDNAKDDLINLSKFPSNAYFSNFNHSIPMIIFSALFGSDIIFDHFIKGNNIFQMKSDIADALIKASIIGGNHRIILTLKRLNFQIDKYFDLSILYHRNDICLWIINSYQLKIENDRFIKLANNGLNFEILSELGIAIDQATEINGISPKKKRMRPKS